MRSGLMPGQKNRWHMARVTGPFFYPRIFAPDSTDRHDGKRGKRGTRTLRKGGKSMHVKKPGCVTTGPGFIAMQVLVVPNLT